MVDRTRVKIFLTDQYKDVVRGRFNYHHPHLKGHHLPSLLRAYAARHFETSGQCNREYFSSFLIPKSNSDVYMPVSVVERLRDLYDPFISFTIPANKVDDLRYELKKLPKMIREVDI